MGCAGSKQSGRCRHCQAAYSPPPVTRRSFSLHGHPFPPTSRDIDANSHHGVAVTCTTDEDEEEVGNITTATKLLSPQPANGIIPCRGHLDHKRDDKEEFEIGVIEAKAWSKMIDGKIPKNSPETPVMTPPGEPETINAWELMEGLEDDALSSLLRVHHRLSPEHYRSHSFSFRNHSTIFSDFDTEHPPKTTAPPPPPEKIKEDDDGSGNTSINDDNPLWMDASTVSDKDGLITKTIVSDFDPEVIAAFRKALEELSPQNPFRLDKCLDPYQHLEEEKKGNGVDFVSEADDNDNKENESYITAATEAQVGGKKIVGVTEHRANDEQHQMSENQSRQKAVLYFTSLRGVRKTYEDCCNVRMILKGLGIRIDERDVSMHSGFKEELKELLRDEYHCDYLFGKSGLVLPRLFVGSKYIGGAEEIRRMHEEGQLEEVLQCCDKVDYHNGGLSAVVCEACADIRFVPCETCSGSCKIYYEAEEEDEVCSKGKEEEEDHEYGFQRCPDCNENGLIRCPICCS